MTIDVATGIARILKQEGVEWVSTFPVCPGEQRPGPGGRAYGDDCAMTVTPLRLPTPTLESPPATASGCVLSRERVNAAGMQYAYAGMAQAFEDGSPVLCITDGVPHRKLRQQPIRRGVQHEDGLQVVRLRGPT